MHACAHVCARVRVCARLHVYVYACACTLECVRVCACMCVRMCLCVHAKRPVLLASIVVLCALAVAVGLLELESLALHFVKTRQ